MSMHLVKLVISCIGLDVVQFQIVAALYVLKLKHCSISGSLKLVCLFPSVALDSSTLPLQKSVQKSRELQTVLKTRNFSNS